MTYVDTPPTLLSRPSLSNPTSCILVVAKGLVICTMLKLHVYDHDKQINLFLERRAAVELLHCYLEQMCYVTTKKTASEYGPGAQE